MIAIVSCVKMKKLLGFNHEAANNIKNLKFSILTCT